MSADSGSYWTYQETRIPNDIEWVWDTDLVNKVYAPHSKACPIEVLEMPEERVVLKGCLYKNSDLTKEMWQDFYSYVNQNGERWLKRERRSTVAPQNLTLISKGVVDPFTMFKNDSDSDSDSDLEK